MSSPSTSSQRRRATPPPSRALLDLQRKGLELAHTALPRHTLTASTPDPTRPTASDRDKPLPLEPREKRRSSSSVYSTDTTISNILRMYGGHRDLDDTTSLPRIHHPQAYRDTIAPLLIKRLSLPQTPSPQPSAMLGLSDTGAPRSVAAAGSPGQLSLPASKTVPTFLEFSRALEHRRHELGSPRSDASPDHHRQAAYDHLAPPSPQTSSVEQSINLSQTPPIPEALSGTISDFDDSDLLPSPLSLRTPSPHSPLFDLSGDLWSPGGAPQARASDSVSPPDVLDQKASPDLPSLSSVPACPVPDQKTFPPRQSAVDKDTKRTMSVAAAKDPSMDGGGTGGSTSHTHSGRSSLQHGVGALLRTLSMSARDSSRRSRDTQSFATEQHMAIPATPYQVYGAEIWSAKAVKKQRQEAKKTKPFGLAHAYQKGQGQFVGVIDGARRKLTRRTSSQSRRTRLKESIVVVGPVAPRSGDSQRGEPGQGRRGSPWL